MVLARRGALIEHAEVFAIDAPGNPRIGGTFILAGSETCALQVDLLEVVGVAIDQR